MKNKIFSKGLYFEGLRQLKMIGIISSVILCVLSAAIPVLTGINMMKWYEDSSEKISREIVGGVTANPFLFLIFLALVPLMALVLFGFLNKRRTSDFYHSIPHTRLSIYISFIAAILTWAAVMILTSSLAAVIAYLVFSKYFIVLYADLLIFMLNAFVIAILAVGSTAIAVSITGTPFSNFLFTAMILLLPRILITVINAVMVMQTPILASGQSFFLFENGYNLYTTVFISVFSGRFTQILSEQYLSVGGMIYTLVLGLIYLALAALLFVKRRSESAERSAPSKLLQTVYRTLVTTAFCMIPCVVIFIVGTNGYGFDTEDIFGLIVLYIMAVILYFVYELITTRKWKNLLRSIPGLGIVLICNLAIIGGLYGARAYHIAYTPTADEITGISVVHERSDGYYGELFGELYYDDYVNSQMGEIVLNSSETKKIIAEGLSGSAGALKEYGANGYWRYGNGYYDEYGNYHNENELKTMTFRIKTKSGSRVRRIKLSQESVDKINELLLADEQYYNLWTKIPDPATYDLRFYPNGYSYSMFDILSTDNQKLFAETLQKEVAAMDYSVWYDVITTGKYTYWGNDSDIIGTVEYPIRTGKSSTRYYVIPISYGSMPKTAALFLKLFSEDAENRNTMLDALKSADKGNVMVDYSINAYCPEDGTFVKYVAYGDFDAAQIAEFLTSKEKSGPVGEGDTYILLHLGTYERYYDEDYHEYYYGRYMMYQAFIPLRDVTEEDLIANGFTKIEVDEPKTEPIYGEGIIYD